MNTKNEHKETIGFQSHFTSIANDLTNSSNLGLTSMYMDTNAKTCNTIWVEKLKTFDFLGDSLNSTSLVYNTVLTLFNYLGADMSKNFIYRKMVNSERVAKKETEFEDHIKKRAPASKSLFVDREQRTLKDYTTLVSNICLEFHA